MARKDRKASYKIYNARRNYHSDWQRNRNYKHNYGITLEEFNVLFERQNGLCAICKIDPKPSRYGIKLHVDHDHISGKVRALVCRKCNVGLSYLEDKNFVAMGDQYLKEHSI